MRRTAVPLTPSPYRESEARGRSRWGEGVKSSQLPDLNPLVLSFYPKGHKSRREKELCIYTIVVHFYVDALWFSKVNQTNHELMKFQLLYMGQQWVRRHKQKQKLKWLLSPPNGDLCIIAPRGAPSGDGAYMHRQATHPPPVPPRYALPLEGGGDDSFKD